MKLFRNQTFSLALLVGVLAPIGASAEHVDFFVDGTLGSTTNLADTGEVSGATSNILGAFRQYSIANNTLDGTVGASLSSGGPLQLTDLGGGQGTYWFGYGTESTSAGSLNTNFIGAANWDSLVFSIGSVTGSGMLSLSVNSGPDTFAFSDLSVSAAGDYTFLYSEALAAIPSFDFTSVDGLNFQVQSDAPNSAFTLSGFTREVAIPEPSTTLLVALAGLALFTRKRRA